MWLRLRPNRQTVSFGNSYSIPPLLLYLFSGFLHHRLGFRIVFFFVHGLVVTGIGFGPEQSLDFVGVAVCGLYFVALKAAEGRGGC